MSDTLITKIEAGTLIGRRPRAAGSNARLGDHGSTVRVPVVQITTTSGTTGFGYGQVDPDHARALLNSAVDEHISPAHGVAASGRAAEFALWDLLGHLVERPVYRLLAEAAGRGVDGPLPVRCYDTSLYFDDLHLSANGPAADLIAGEAREGLARGHSAFKIKVGRGARHMPVDAGTDRDIAVIHAVREAVGPDARIMLDANNGYTLNLAKRVLAETADVRLHWLEEAFHEDPVLFADLREWLDKQGIDILIADGEGDASPHLLHYAKDGLIDVVQYDIFSYGLSAWLETGRSLDRWGRQSAPHHYGRYLGNFVSGHLAAVVGGFAMVEWDAAEMPGIDASAYCVVDGHVTLPDLPGFGLELDAAVLQQAADYRSFT